MEYTRAMFKRNCHHVSWRILILMNMHYQCRLKICTSPDLWFFGFWLTCNVHFSAVCFCTPGNSKITKHLHLQRLETVIECWQQKVDSRFKDEAYIHILLWFWNSKLQPLKHYRVNNFMCFLWVAKPDPV